MQNKTQTLQQDSFYHIYNRANGNENIFIKEKNYLFFLKQFKQRIHPIAQIYCYCIMLNHFHFLIQIKTEEELKSFFNKAYLPSFKNLEGLISQQFSIFFNSYSKAFNKQQARKGSLYMMNFKQKKNRKQTISL